jgi:hypothetical protein
MSSMIAHTIRTEQLVARFVLSTGALSDVALRHGTAAMHERREHAFYFLTRVQSLRKR